MLSVRRWCHGLPVLLACGLLGVMVRTSPELAAQGATALEPGLLRELRWRNIGPHRASRTKAVAGVPAQPNVFYIGVVNGGVWKTTDYGRTWIPIFDDQPTGSIGAIAVAPSDPEHHLRRQRRGLQRPDLSTGDGIYKSTDAGKTWTHLGLRDGQQIPQIVVDPRNPEPPLRRRARPPVRPERGARHLPLDRRRPDVREGALQGREHRRRRRRASIRRTRDIVYAALWEARQGPWENGDFTRARQRPAQVHRRRHDLAAAHARACRRSERTASAASASRSRRAIRAALRHRRGARAQAASTAPTTRARSGTRVNSDARVVARRRTTSPR